MPDLYHLLKMISQGEAGEARRQLAAILQDNPNHLEAWSLMALAVGHPAQKADCYRRILALDPGNENARYQLALLEKNQAAASATTIPSAPIGSSGFVTKPVPASSIIGALTRPPTPEPENKAMERLVHAAEAAPNQTVQALIDTPAIPSTSILEPAHPAETASPVAAAALSPTAAGAPAQAPDQPVENFSQKLGYFGVGILILSIGGMFLGLGSSAITGSAYNSVPASITAAICYSAFTLVIIPFFVYLAHKGWDAPPQMNLLLKLSWLFVVALPTPWGWYWMGRGASRLVQAAIDRRASAKASSRQRAI